MIQFAEVMNRWTYKDAVKDFPTLQERVFNALRDMTPNEFGTELIEEGYADKYNRDYIDSATYFFLATLLKSKLEEKRLMLTNDDVYCAWQRGVELVFLFEGVKQGVLEEFGGEDGGSRYKVKGLDEASQLQRREVRHKFSAKTYRSYSRLK